MTAPTTQPMTAEAFWQRYADKRSELILGEVVETVEPGGLHGGYSLNIGTLLRAFVRLKGGYATVETGFLLERNPDLLRLPDVAYVQAARIPETGIPENYWSQAPDVAVEVISPSELASDVQEKVLHYLRAGVEQVWTVYPRQKSVTIHTAEGLARTLGMKDTLEGFGVLEGLRCTVAELFEL